MSGIILLPLPLRLVSVLGMPTAKVHTAELLAAVRAAGHKFTDLQW